MCIRDRPYSGIRLKVYEGDREIDGSQLKWQLETLGGTSRRVAAVNQDSGELTVMSNGLVRVRAVDAETLMGGEVLIYVNMQVECEYACLLYTSGAHCFGGGFIYQDFCKAGIGYEKTRRGDLHR